MKLVIMAAALLVGGTAAAQTAEDQSAAPAAAGVPCTGPKTVAADNGAPRLDARGIPVISSDGMAPDCYNEAPRQAPAGTQPGSPTPGVGESGSLPPCTRTVTDRCVQTYERRRPR